ncbi:MAG: zinc ribbon domain-containing protein [Acholeplasmataceae bacterium]|nr:zinc-ribbon domain-containing protein [Acholeplasmataceae bacterium]
MQQVFIRKTFIFGVILTDSGEENTNYCKNCGSEVDVNARVCVSCGHSLKENAKVVKQSDTAGTTLGIVSLIAWLLPLAGFPVSMVGLVISVKRKKCGHYFKHYWFSINHC